MVQARNVDIAAYNASFRFIYTGIWLKAEQQAHYIFTVEGPSGMNFEVRERFSVIEEWYKKMAKDLQATLKKRNL